MNEIQYYVYILTNKNHTVFYTGVTSNLLKRLYEHSNELVDSFTKRYHIHELIYYEIHSDITIAIQREKTIKKWKREWKWNLINKVNPLHQNLYCGNNILPIEIAQ